MPKIVLKDERKFGRTNFAAVNPESKALLKLMKRDYIYPEELPFVHKLGFNIYISGNQITSDEDNIPFIKLQADINYGTVLFKVLGTVGDALSILMGRGNIKVEELPLLKQLGFQFDKVTGYIKQASHEMERMELNLKLTKDGVIQNVEQQSKQSK